jgi:hypothetical protein
MPAPAASTGRWTSGRPTALRTTLAVGHELDDHDDVLAAPEQAGPVAT